MLSVIYAAGKLPVCMYLTCNLPDTNNQQISRSFTQKMAPKTGWQRYETKLRH